MTPAFPLAALVGQPALVEALLINAVAPDVGGVVVRGERGTAKSTAVRSLAPLLPPVRAALDEVYAFAPGEVAPGGVVPLDAAVEERPAPLVELPIGATLDRLVGALDLGRALGGEHAFEPGLLARAHQGILYVDEVNLLPDHLVDALLDAAAAGVARVERESVSVEHAARFVLVGTMNVEEGELRPQLLDRFGLGVEVRAPRDAADRAEIVRRRLAFEADPAGFAASFREAEAELAARIAAARSRLPSVRLPERELMRITGACARLGVDGVRGDIVTARAARALAALAGADEVDEDHVRRAASLALAHRRRRDPLATGHDNHEAELASALTSDDHDPDDPGPGGNGRAPAGTNGGPHGTGNERSLGAPPGADPYGTGAPDGSGTPHGAGPDARVPRWPRGRTRTSPESTTDERGHRPISEDAGPTGPSGHTQHSPESTVNWLDHQPTSETPGPASAGAASGPGATDEFGSTQLPADTKKPGLRPVAAMPALLPRSALALPGAGEGPAGRRARTAGPGAGSIDSRPLIGPRPASATGATGSGPAGVGVPADADIAIVATLRARLVGEDAIHEHVRAGREGALICLVVDASGSMGTRRRLARVKGALLELLRDAYARRDRVAVIAFSGEAAHLLVNPGAPLERAADAIRNLPTGGRTPLAAGLDAATTVLRRERAREARRRSIAVVLTDGRVNDPHAQIPAAAHRLARAASAVHVVDTEDGPVRLGLAAALAHAAGAHLHALQDPTRRAA